MYSISIMYTCAGAVFFLSVIVHGGLITRNQEEDAQLTPLERLILPLDTGTGQVDMSSNSQHLNHHHTRNGRCFFTSPASSSPDMFSGGMGGFDVFDIDPRFAQNQAQLALQQAQLDLPAPIAYQILQKSGDLMALSPITYLSSANNQES